MKVFIFVSYIELMMNIWSSCNNLVVNKLFVWGDQRDLYPWGINLLPIVGGQRCWLYFLGVEISDLVILGVEIGDLALLSVFLGKSKVLKISGSF